VAEVVEAGRGGVDGMMGEAILVVEEGAVVGEEVVTMMKEGVEAILVVAGKAKDKGPGMIGTIRMTTTAVASVEEGEEEGSRTGEVSACWPGHHAQLCGW
jgi:hypothetical protein